MMQQSLHYGDVQIAYSLRHLQERSAGRIAIHVEPDGRVVVDAPPHASPHEVKQAVRKRAAWIHRQLVARAEHRDAQLPREYVSGESWLYLGRRFRLRVVTQEGALGSAVLRGSYIEVHVPRRNAELVSKALGDWYLAHAKSFLPQRVQSVAANFRWLSTPPSVTVRSMSLRWGSCSPAGRLSLNTALIKASRDCIDYVIAHELAHLKHHDHGAAFRRELQRVVPDWMQVKQRLDRLAEQLLRT